MKGEKAQIEEQQILSCRDKAEAIQVALERTYAFIDMLAGEIPASDETRDLPEPNGNVAWLHYRLDLIGSAVDYINRRLVDITDLV